MGNLLSGGQEQGYQDLGKGVQKGEGMMDPFRSGGQQGLTQLLHMLGQGQDPNALIQQIQSQFQQSPAQHFAQQQATGAAQNQLQSQGIAGSGAGAQALAQLTSNITGQQQQQNLQNVLGLRQNTLGSLLGLSQLGLGAAGKEADLAGEFGQAQAGGDEAHAAGINKLLGMTILGAPSGLAGMMGGAGGAGAAAGGAGGMGALAGLL